MTYSYQEKYPDKLKAESLKFEVTKVSPAYGRIEECAFSAINYN